MGYDWDYFEKKMDYDRQENKQEIQQFVQKYHKNIVIDELEYQRRLHRKAKTPYSIEAFCADCGISKSTYYDWIRNDRPLRSRGFTIISQFSSFRKLYYMHLLSEMIQNTPVQEKMEHIITLIYNTPYYPIWQAIIDAFSYIEENAIPEQEQYRIFSDMILALEHQPQINIEITRFPTT